MPFHCKICDLDILPGTPMVSNDRSELAHDECVKSVILHRVTSPNLEPKKTVPLKPVPVTAPEPCVMPSKPHVCVECSDQCIALCPACLKLVCQAYGWNGKTCSIAHEGKCSGARALREPPPKQIITEIKIVNQNGNGKHKTVGKKVGR